MDGAMPKTVLIILAAVVALIVIVVLTGMRYLRADDDDDFDDNVSAEHGRSRSRGSHPVAGQARNRQMDASDLPDERPRERVGAARGARSGQGRREDRGVDRRGDDQRAMDQRGSGRGGQDRSWREDSAVTRRAAHPAREQRPARTARRDRDDISEPLTAVRTPRTSARGRGDDYDSLPGRRTSSAEHDRDRRNGRERASGYDDVAARGDGRDSRDRRDRSDNWPGRDSRDGRDRSDLRDSRSVPSIRDDADRDDRDRRSSTRPNARPDARKNGSKPDDELLPAVKPRQTKNKRESEGDWPSNEWDELSDVDYWAELASDKPFSAGSTDEPPRSERRDARAERDVASERTRRADRASRTDNESRQDRDARQDSRIGAEAITKQMSRPPREPDSAILPAARHRDLPADRPTAARPADPRPVIADDDPLTSPSFPRVAADDSRSYRRSRSAGPDPRHDVGRGSDPSRQPLPGGRSSSEPSYPSMPPVEPVRGYDNASTTRRHALPAASAPTASDAYPASAPGYGGDPTAGIADPYGSPLPIAPPPASSSVPAGYQVPAVSGAYQAPGASYGIPDSANGSHSLSAPYGEPAGYPGAASYSSPAAAGYREANGLPPSGYLPPVGGSGFAADARSGSYQSLPPAPDGYRTDLSSGGYQGGGAGYDNTGYESTSSYSPPSSPAGYGNGNGTGERAAEYPGSGYQNGDYQGYGEATSASGSHRRPEPGYSQGSYQGASGPSMPALPAAPPEPGYPAYQAPVPNGQNGYAAANPQPPGYGAAPYPPAGYDQAGYPLPAPDANGYAGADPYAADPYGQHGYPGNGY
jgi:hypothetical protein